MAKNENIGKCGICGLNGKLTFEHIPPKAAKNDAPVYIYNSDNILDSKSRFYGLRNKSHRGFGRYSLCKECNNKTGDWYARDFSEFVKQGLAKLEDVNHSDFFLEEEYTIKPLNVLKQFLVMLLSSDFNGYLQSRPDVIDFVLTKNIKTFPKGIKLYLYISNSDNRRMAGYSISFSGKGTLDKWCEIAFKPFGIMLCHESLPARKEMLNITYFEKYDYDEVVNVKLLAPILYLSNTSLPGNYL